MKLSKFLKFCWHLNYISAFKIAKHQYSIDRINRDQLKLPNLSAVTGRKIAYCSIISDQVQYHRQIITWALSVINNLPKDQYIPYVFFTNHCPQGLIKWLKGKGVNTRVVQGGIAKSTHRHTDKIIPFLLDFEEDMVMVTDADVYAVKPFPINPQSYISVPRNNMAMPPYYIWEKLYEDPEIIRPIVKGEALLPNPITGSTITAKTNHSGGIIIMPNISKLLIAKQWLAWSKWVSDRQSVLQKFSIFTDQISLALTMHELNIEPDFLPDTHNVIVEQFLNVSNIESFHITHRHQRGNPQFFPNDELVVPDATELSKKSISLLNTIRSQALEEIENNVELQYLQNSIFW